MPTDITTNLKLVYEGEVQPVELWLNEGHGRPVWVLSRDSVEQSSSKRLVPRSPSSLLIDGLILAVILNWPKSALKELTWFDVDTNMLDLTNFDLTDDQWQLVYETLGLDLFGSEVRLAFMPDSGVINQVTDLNKFNNLLASIARVSSFDETDVEYAELWPVGTGRFAEKVREYREGPADKIQRDLDAISTEEASARELKEDPDKDPEA
jgi:hypothetical protein